MKKEVYYKTDLVDSLISQIPNQNHFIEVKRSQKRLSTTSISKKSQSSLPKKKIKVEDIKVEKEDSGWVQSFFSKSLALVCNFFKVNFSNFWDWARPLSLNHQAHSNNTTFALIKPRILLYLLEYCLNFPYSNSFERWRWCTPDTTTCYQTNPTR